MAGVTHTAGSWPRAHEEEGPDGAVLLVPAIDILNLSRACFSSTKHARAVPWHGGFAVPNEVWSQKAPVGCYKELPLFPLQGKLGTGTHSALTDFSQGF